MAKFNIGVHGNLTRLVLVVARLENLGEAFGNAVNIMRYNQVTNLSDDHVDELFTTDNPVIVAYHSYREYINQHREDMAVIKDRIGVYK